VSRRIAIAGLVLFAVAAVIGAYADWVLWESDSGILITMAVAALLLVALVFGIVPRRRSRQIALLIAATALGVVAGQTLGPSRPALTQTDGTISIVLTSPHAATGTSTTICAMDNPATELSVSGDPNLRLDILPDDPSAPADVDQRAFVGVYVSIGDRWFAGPYPRSDNVRLLVVITGAIGKVAETRMESSAASSLERSWTAAGGTMTFAGLVPDVAGASGDTIDLAGTITWTC
jgi:hypothetical protein